MKYLIIEIKEREVFAIFTVKSLPAHDGDSFIISFGEEGDIKNIIVDGGRRKKVVRKLKEEINTIKEKGQSIDLLVLTHIDDDHIYGLIKIFEDSEIDKSIIKKVWFNSKELISEHIIGEKKEDENFLIHPDTNNEISFRQGVSFGNYLKIMGLSSSSIISSGHELIVGKAMLKVLSPNLKELESLYHNWDKEFRKHETNGTPISGKRVADYDKSIEEVLSNNFIEDSALANGSSIAFSLEFEGRRLLMLGDSFPSVVAENLESLSGNEEDKILFNLIKVSHHGSKHNTNDHILNLINCSNYLISTNGSSHFLPNKEVLVRIASAGDNTTTKKIYFNYPDYYEQILTEMEKEILNVECIHVGDSVIDLMRVE